MTYNNAPILERFMRDASEGVPVWYTLDESKTAADGFVLQEPTEDGKPWTFVGGQECVDRLLRIVPQATRVWLIPDDIAQAFMGKVER